MGTVDESGVLCGHEVGDEKVVDVVTVDCNGSVKKGQLGTSESL